MNGEKRKKELKDGIVQLVKYNIVGVINTLVDFLVYQAVNNISFCDFLQEKGELPDIILMRRFSLNDTKLIRDQLMDLKNTEVAARFHSSILEQNKDENGEVKWLPAGAEVEGLIANRALF